MVIVAESNTVLTGLLETSVTDNGTVTLRAVPSESWAYTVNVYFWPTFVFGLSVSWSCGSIVETTVTTIESAAYTPSESCALMRTRPALSPHTSTEVSEDSAGITRRGNSGPPQAVAGRATRVSTAGITDRKTVLGAESVRLNVNGTDTLPPLPTESESLGTPHRSNAGGATTTSTRVESS